MSESIPRIQPGKPVADLDEASAKMELQARRDDDVAREDVARIARREGEAMRAVVTHSDAHVRAKSIAVRVAIERLTLGADALGAAILKGQVSGELLIQVLLTDPTIAAGVRAGGPSVPTLDNISDDALATALIAKWAALSAVV